MDLNGVRMFISVAQAGSLSAAAEKINVPLPTLSRRIRELERELKVQLLERSSRGIKLTEPGSRLYEFASRGIEALNEAQQAVMNDEARLKGRLRLSLPPAFDPWWEVLGAFQQRYPEITLSVFSTERRVDLVQDGIDVALRVGDRQSRSSIARNLGAYRHKLVATPDFLARYSVQTPDDLKRVPCIAWGHQGREVHWQLGAQTIAITPKLMVNDYQQLSSMVLSGAWITELPPFQCMSLIKGNALVEVLPEAPLPEQALSLLYPSRKNLPRITRVFIDFIASHLLSALAAEGPNDR